MVLNQWMEWGTIFSDVYQNSFMVFLVMFGQTHLVHLGGSSVDPCIGSNSREIISIFR